MNDIEMILGYPTMDMSGEFQERWAATKGKDRFMRWYDTGFKLICHKTTITVEDDFGNYMPEEGWVISLGLEDVRLMAIGRKTYDTAKQAKASIENMDDEALMYLQMDADMLRSKLPINTTSGFKNDVGF